MEAVKLRKVKCQNWKYFALKVQRGANSSLKWFQFYEIFFTCVQLVQQTAYLIILYLVIDRNNLNAPLWYIIILNLFYISNFTLTAWNYGRSVEAVLREKCKTDLPFQSDLPHINKLGRGPGILGGIFNFHGLASRTKELCELLNNWTGSLEIWRLCVHQPLQLV